MELGNIPTNKQMTKIYSQNILKSELFFLAFFGIPTYGEGDSRLRHNSKFNHFLFDGYKNSK